MHGWVKRGDAFCSEPLVSKVVRSTGGYQSLHIILLESEVPLALKAEPFRTFLSFSIGGYLILAEHSFEL